MYDVVTRQNYKRKIIEAILLGTVYASLLFFLDFFLDKEIQTINGLIIQGIIFGFSMIFGFPYIYRKFQKNDKFKSKPELLKDEKIENEYLSNINNGIELESGKIYLTDKRLIFKRNSFNLNQNQNNLLYEDISKVTKIDNTENNEINIHVKSGIIYNLITENRDELVIILEDKINELQQRL